MTLNYKQAQSVAKSIKYLKKDGKIFIIGNTAHVWNNITFTTPKPMKLGDIHLYDGKKYKKVKSGGIIKYILLT